MNLEYSDIIPENLGITIINDIEIKDISFVKCHPSLSKIYFAEKYSKNKSINRKENISMIVSNYGFIKINKHVHINPVQIKKIVNSKKREVIMKCGTSFNVSRRRWHLIRDILIHNESFKLSEYTAN